MIIDKIENHQLYSGLEKRIYSALAYLKNTDFSKIENGRHDIDENMYLLLSNYTTKNSTECKIEAHQKYADVQYMISGKEFVGYAPLCEQVPTMKYDEENDYILFEGDVSLIEFHEGMFAIFYPYDLHMPGVGDNNLPVRKAVVKVRL